MGVSAMDPVTVAAVFESCDDQCGGVNVTGDSNQITYGRPGQSEMSATHRLGR